LEEAAKQNQKKVKTITPNAIQQLQNYSWPGNVRELKNLVERMAIMVNKDTIDILDIPAPYNPDATESRESSKSDLFQINDLKDAKKAFEKAFIKQKLLEHEENITKTAKTIGVGRSYLHKKLKD
jgi:two-component system nitrogen regulation response regulator NtrX